MSGDGVILPRLLTPAQVAEYLGCSNWSLYQMLKRGCGPPCFKLGRRYKISEPDLAAWIVAQGQLGRRKHDPPVNGKERSEDE
jgi:excisionase family DNA binding protein